MAKFGHIFISGLIWIALEVGIGLVGIWMTGLDGLWCILGWIIVVVAFGSASMSAGHLWRITSFQVKGMRMMRIMRMRMVGDDPEAVEARRRYEEAVRSVEDEETEDKAPR